MLVPVCTLLRPGYLYFTRAIVLRPQIFVPLPMLLLSTLYLVRLSVTCCTLEHEARILTAMRQCDSSHLL